VAEAICLMLLGIVLGYLAEREKSCRARILAVGQLVTRNTPEAGMRETVERALRTISSLMAARQVVLAVQDDRGGKAFAWVLNDTGLGGVNLQFIKLSLAGREQHFFHAPARSGHWSRRASADGESVFRCLVPDAEGRRLPDKHFPLAGAFFLEGSFRSCKHSDARNVGVRFAFEDGCWRLVIADDGRGFEFSGRLSGTERLAVPSAPAVLRERAPSIGADVEIESTPGQGSRVEILLHPQESYG
jgi:hypothetical protein